MSLLSQIQTIGRALDHRFVALVGSAMRVIERTTTDTNNTGTAMSVQRTTTGNMADGFGVTYGWYIEDDAGVANMIAGLECYRDGADNSGKMRLWIRNAGGYTTVYYMLKDGGVLLPNIKSGATQVGAGAAAGEVWKTASHATLPDNVLMIGV